MTRTVGVRSSPGASASTLDPAGLQHIKYIEDFAVLLSDFSSHDRSPEALSFSTLADKFRVMATSPAWPQVSLAIARLKDAVARGYGYAVMQEDSGLVEHFHALVTRNAGRIAQALVCAAAIGRASDLRERSARVLKGLEVLSKGLKFDTRNEEEIGKILLRVAEEIDYFFAPARKLSAMVPDGARDDYEKRLEAALRRASEFPKREYWIAVGVVILVWDQYRERVISSLRGGVSLPPEVEELCCAAAGVGPLRIMRFQPSENTLGEWTSAFFSALPDFANRSSGVYGASPQWLAAAALDFLGLAGRPECVEALKRYLPEVEPFFNEIGSSGARARGSVLVLRLAEDSRIGAWERNESSYMVLMPNAVEVEWLRKHRDLLSVMPGPMVVAVELAPDQRINRLDRLLRDFGVEVSDAVYLYRSQPVEPAGPAALVGPSTLDQIFEAGGRQLKK